MLQDYHWNAYHWNRTVNYWLTRILELEAQLNGFDQGTLVSPFQTNLKDILEKFEHEIMAGIKKTFVRDKFDFEKTNAFKWRHMGNKRPSYPSTNKSTNSTRTPYTSSSSDFLVLRDERKWRRTRRGRHKSKKTKLQIQRPSTEHEDKQETPVVSSIQDSLQIINLSTYRLDPAKISVLQRGLTFSSSWSLNKFIMTKDFFLFCRKLIFKTLYSQRTLPDSIAETDWQLCTDLMDLLNENEDNTTTNKFPLKKKSCAMPRLSLCPSVQVFYNLVSQKIRQLHTNSVRRRNLTEVKRRAVNNLQNNQDFFINEADKGGNVVLWPFNMYLDEALAQLNNTLFY